MGYAHSYADAIMHRGRIPMEPIGFVPDWTDRPRKWKHYPGLESYPLPDADPTAHGAAGTVQEALFGEGGDGRFDLALLGGMLRDSYGLLGRRLGIQSNTDMASLPSYTHANWHRGAASGGGLYPVSIYLVTAGAGPYLPGVYHYSPAQHAMQTLLVGDVSGDVRDALGDEGDTAGCQQFLVLGVKYWQNAFKYNSFCFHAVSMDVGAAVQTMRMWARSAGLSADPQWWFDEGRVADLLGLDDREGIFAVVPLRWGDRDPETTPHAVARPMARVAHVESERSREVLTFEAVEGMQAATSQRGPGRPAAGALRVAAVPALPRDGRNHRLAAATRLDTPMRATLRTRRSSFGRFDARAPLSASRLNTALQAAAQAAADTVPIDSGERLAGLYVFVNHVDGLEPGIYVHADDTLRLLESGAPGEFLQHNYFLANYNLEQAAAVVVPTIRTGAVLDAVGARGYRLVNATVGAMAQAFYSASSCMGIGCGVALGFDSVSYIERLGLAETGELPLLLMMLGAERPGSADFRYEIA